MGNRGSVGPEIGIDMVRRVDIVLGRMRHAGMSDDADTLDEYMSRLERVAARPRFVGPDAAPGYRRIGRRVEAFCHLHDRWEASTNDADHTPAPRQLAWGRR